MNDLSHNTKLLEYLLFESSCDSIEKLSVIKDTLIKTAGFTFLKVVSCHTEEFLKLFLANRTNVNARSENGFGAIHHSVFNSRLEVLRLVLSLGLDVNGVDAYKRTPLHLACRLKDFDKIQLMVRTGAHVNAVDCKGKTPLMYLVDNAFIAGKNRVELKTTMILLMRNLGTHELVHILPLVEDKFRKCVILAQLALKGETGEDYLEECTRELDRAKTRKLQDGVSLYDLLVGGHRELVRDKKAIDESEMRDWEREYPIYWLWMKTYFHELIEMTTEE